MLETYTDSLICEISIEYRYFIFVCTFYDTLIHIIFNIVLVESVPVALPL